MRRQLLEQEVSASALTFVKTIPSWPIPEQKLVSYLALFRKP